MNLKEIHDAAMNGHTFRFTGKIEQFSFENGKLKIDWAFPDAGKLFNSNHDFAYIEVASKYDPCRKFRNGDIVTPQERNGRVPWGKGTKLKVVADESKAGVTVRCDDTGEERLMCVLFLELVTPVEELEPYTISEGAGIIEVYNEKFEVVKAWCYRDVKAGVKALAEAEAECARLNEECRKEREND